MSDLNVVTFTGRLVKDPELTYNDKKRAITRATVANNVGFGNTASTNYIRIVTAGQVAKYLAKFGNKGRQVAFNGELRLSSHKDEDGKWNNSSIVFVRELSFIGNGKHTGEDAEPVNKSNAEPQFTDSVSQAYADAYSLAFAEPENTPEVPSGTSVSPAYSVDEDIPF